MVIQFRKIPIDDFTESCLLSIFRLPHTLSVGAENFKKILSLSPISAKISPLLSARTRSESFQTGGKGESSWKYVIPLCLNVLLTERILSLSTDRSPFFPL